jgi:hypothetical protein
VARFPLPIASYRLPTPTASSSILKNCYIEQAPKDSTKGPVILRRAPGILAWGGVETEEISVRGMHVMADVLYAVIGTNLYSVDSTGAATDIGDITGTERVVMADNGNDLIIVRPDAPTFAYHYDGATTAQITDPVFLGFGGAIAVGFIDGYFVFLPPDSNQVFNSGLNAVTFNALDVFTAEGASGSIIGMLIDHREIILTKHLTTEIWYDAANATGSPFSRSPDGLMDMGSSAGDSLNSQDNSPFWLANDKTIRRLDSATPQKVSQFGIDSEIQRLSQVEDAFSLSYEIDGHLFLAFTFAFSGRTYVFDCATNEWHNRESYQLGRWRGNCTAKAYGYQLVGDSITGRIGIIDPDTFYEWDDPQVLEFQYQPIYGEGNRISINRFELVTNTGNSPLTGQGSQPLVTLFLSYDGGNTFTAMPMRSLGETGQYTERVVWWQCGSGYEIVPKIQISDPVPVFSTDTQIEARGGRF